MAQRIRFVLNGEQHELTRADVMGRLSGHIAEPGRKHLVEVDGQWFPVMQAFELVTGVPRRDFISHTARRHFAALGFRLHGEIEHRDGAGPLPTVDRPNHGAESAGTAASVEAVSGLREWHTEERVQSLLVSWLASEGFEIISVANTATKEHGVDVVARRDGEVVGFEVKGYPSLHYADPRRAGESKRTSPSTQAGHWYSQAILAAMRLRGREPAHRSAIALPDFPRFRSLYAETRGSLRAAAIEVFWISENGRVERGS